jgi:glycosyltransferase involved in cell wall biosynthesis
MPARNTPGWAAFAFASMPRMGRLAREADVVHAQDIASVLPGMVARRVRGAPLVTTYHTSHFLRRAESRFWRPVFRRFLRAADHNLAASREIAAVGEALAPGIEVEALTNGVETDLFRRVDGSSEPPPAPGRRRLIVPRRLFHKNGVEYLVRAMPSILSQVDTEAVLVGDGPERGRLEALAGELGVSDRVRFLGARPHGEMPALLSSADLAVFPSLMEATSVAALECMACEVPVAASNVGGLPEIVDDEVGGLFEPADPEGMAQVVVRLLRDPDLAEAGARARSRVVDRWSNARLADRHLEVYGELLRRRRAA